MAFERPTLQEIIDRAEGDIKGSLGITTILRRSFLSAIARAIAGVTHVLHGHLVFLSRQIFVDQAEAEFLDRWGSIYGIERNPATFAQLNMDFTFQSAVNVPAGTALTRSDGVGYTLDADVDATGESSFPVTLQGVITADDPGDDPNTDDGEVIPLATPIAGVDTDVVVSSTATEGEDEESDDSYRQRIVDRIQEPPSGGRANDYIQAARAVSGVTRAWVRPGHLGQGTVGVFIVDDDSDPIIPSVAKVAEVQTAINEFKPVTAEATVFAPVANPLDLDIQIKPNTQAVRDAVTTEIEDLISREAQVRGGLREAGTGTTYDGKIPLSRINEAISIAQGEEDHVLLSPTVDAQPGTVGGIMVKGTLTFSTLA